MSINWWTIALQAVNVLILVWLLSRVFWRPVAQAIVKRQNTSKALLADAQSTQATADAALAEVTKTRAGLAAEREVLLADASTKATAATTTLMAEASENAESLLLAARQLRKRESTAAITQNAADSALLAVDIARKLLARLDLDKIHATFLDSFVEPIERMTAADKQMLLNATGGIDLVSAVELDDEARLKVSALVGHALDGGPALNFLTDPDLIAGFEMRTQHFVLRDNWQSDLATILADLKHAA